MVFPRAIGVTEDGIRRSQYKHLMASARTNFEQLGHCFVAPDTCDTTCSAGGSPGRITKTRMRPKGPSKNPRANHVPELRFLLEAATDVTIANSNQIITTPIISPFNKDHR